MQVQSNNAKVTIDNLNRKVKEATGNDVGFKVSWEDAYNEFEQGCSGIKGKFRNTDLFTSGSTYASSAMNILFQKRNETGHGQVVVYYFPDNLIADTHKFYFMCMNMGSYLTGDALLAGNGSHLACTSLASVSWDFAESPTDENRRNFISTIGWVTQFFENTMSDSASKVWKESKDSLDMLLKQTSSENLLKPIAATVVLGSMGRPIDRWSLLCKIMTSVCRTYHDCDKTLITPDSLGRIFVYMFLLDLLAGVPLETVVTKSKEDFVRDFLSQEGDNDTVRVLTVIVGKIFSNTTPDVCAKISNIFFQIIDPKKVSSLSKTDITGNLLESLVVEGEMIEPMNLTSGSWKTDVNTTVLAQTDAAISTGPVNSGWGVTGWSIPVGSTSGRLDISGEYTGGTGGKPGVRTYTGIELLWFKKGSMGLTSNGGRGDGTGKPTPLDGTCSVDLESFRTMNHLLTITFAKKGNTYEVMAKFSGWNKFHKIDYRDGNKILLASKGFSLEIKTSDIVYETKSAGGGGTTLASLTGGSNVVPDHESPTSGMRLAADLEKLSVFSTK